MNKRLSLFVFLALLAIATSVKLRSFPFYLRRLRETPINATITMIAKDHISHVMTNELSYNVNTNFEISRDKPIALNIFVFSGNTITIKARTSRYEVFLRAKIAYTDKNGYKEFNTGTDWTCYGERPLVMYYSLFEEYKMPELANAKWLYLMGKNQLDCSFKLPAF